MWARTPYDNQAKQLIHKLKFERAQAAARDIAAALANHISADTPWIVTYVPTASVRVRVRGYDQSRLIARELAHLLGRPYAPLLVRTAAVRQVGQSRTARREQVRHAFRAIGATRMQNQQILLIDDVITTGATCEAAAQTLLQAGAKQVAVAVFAAA